MINPENPTICAYGPTSSWSALMEEGDRLLDLGDLEQARAILLKAGAFLMAKLTEIHQAKMAAIQSR